MAERDKKNAKHDMEGIYDQDAQETKNAHLWWAG